MATPYKELTDLVLDKVKSLGIPNITEPEADELLSSYLSPACIRFKCCKQDLKNRDDATMAFNIDLNEEEQEILATLMLVEYYSANYVFVPSLLKQNLTSVDFRVFSSKNHLDGLVNLRDVYKKESRQLMSAYSNIGSDLFSALSNGSTT